MTNQVYAQWTAEQILDFLNQQGPKLREFGVSRIGVFGSVAWGEQHPGSDIDLVFTMEPMTFSGWMDVWNFLEDSFGCSVDRVPERDIRPELRERILTEARYVQGL